MHQKSPPSKSFLAKQLLPFNLVIDLSNKIENFKRFFIVTIIHLRIKTPKTTEIQNFIKNIFPVQSDQLPLPNSIIQRHRKPSLSNYTQSKLNCLKHKWKKRFLQWLIKWQQKCEKLILQKINWKIGFPFEFISFLCWTVEKEKKI